MKWLPIWAASVMLASGCRPFHANNRNSNEFVWELRSPIKTLDPAAIEDTVTGDALRQVFETLVTIDSQGHTVALLAEKWDTSSDGRTVTFQLKRGVKFSNGEALTSEDVKFSFERIRNPGIEASTALSALKEIDGIELADPLAIRIHLLRPDPSFVSRLAYPALAIVCHRGTPADRMIRSIAEMVGTGPFVPTEFVSDQVFRIRPRANDDLPGITFLTIRDDSTRISKFRAGEADLCALPPTDIAGVMGDSQLHASLHLTPEAAFIYLQINGKTAPVLRDPRVRRALAMAIDRKRLVDTILMGVPKIATGVLPTGIPGNELQNCALPFRPEEARRLLTQVGFPGGRSFPKIAISVATSGRDNPTADEIVTDWRKNLGIDATVRLGASSSLLDQNERGELPLYLTGWSGDFADAEDYIPPLLQSHSGTNRSEYTNALVDALIAQAQRGGPHRIKALLEAEEIALSYAPIIPLYERTEAELVSTRFKGLQFTPFGHLSLQTLHK